MRMAERKSWDEYFIDMANVVATRSTCLRRHVGAVLVSPTNHIISTGYNGAPAHLEHCSELGCIRSAGKIPSGERHELCRAVHAEQNTLLQAAKHGVSTEGSTLYVTVSPCILCAKMLINAGVRRVVYVGEYPDVSSFTMLQQAGVKLHRLEGGVPEEGLNS